MSYKIIMWSTLNSVEIERRKIHNPIVQQGSKTKISKQK